MHVCQDLLNHWEAEGDKFLGHTVTSEEMWCHHKSQNQNGSHILLRCEPNTQAVSWEWNSFASSFREDGIFRQICTRFLFYLRRFWMCGFVPFVIHWMERLDPKHSSYLKCNVFSKLFAHLVISSCLTKHDFWSGLMHLQVGLLKVSSTSSLKASVFLFNLSDTKVGVLLQFLEESVRL